MKRFLKYLILFVLILTGCTDEKIISEDTKTFKEEYESLNNSGIEVNINEEDIDILNFNEVKSLLTEGSGVVYFGFPSCPWCRNIVPILLDVLEDNNETLNYVNVRNLSSEDYNSLKEMLIDYLTNDKEGVPTFYVPDVYFIKEGKIVGNHLGSVKTQSNPYVSLDINQKEELYNIYNELLKKVKEK